MDIENDVWAGNGEEVTVIEDVFIAIFESLSPSILFGEPIATDGGSHGTIEHKNAFFKGGGKFGCGVWSWHDTF